MVLSHILRGICDNDERDYLRAFLCSGVEVGASQKEFEMKTFVLIQELVARILTIRRGMQCFQKQEFPMDTVAQVPGHVNGPDPCGVAKVRSLLPKPHSNVRTTLCRHGNGCAERKSPLRRRFTLPGRQLEYHLLANLAGISDSPNEAH